MTDDDLPTTLAGVCGDAADALVNLRRLVDWVAARDTEGCALAMARTALVKSEALYAYLACGQLPA